MNFVNLLEEHVLDHALFGVKGAVVTKHMLMLAIAALLMILSFAVIPKFKSRIFKKAAVLIEMFVLFIRDEILVSVMGEEGRKYTGYFATLFFFILFANLLGLVPFGASATGNISVTAALALTSLGLIIFSGVKHKGFFGYFKGLVPSGVPIWIAPILFPIEILGLITRTFALCIRLFANMIAGHIVILSFIGLIFLFGSVLIAPVSIAADIALSLLEIFIAFLQAYIFTLLTAIFLSEAVHSH